MWPEKTGLIFNIQRFSTHDGPGIRTTVFLKGCNLRCVWCHNPESISPRVQLEFNAEKCIGCGKCFAVCKNHTVLQENSHTIRFEHCTGCMRCVGLCYAQALVQVGYTISVDALLKEIETDLMYFQTSNGGVTFSGGEPMLQADFLADALAVCQQRGIHTAVDTAGDVPFAEFEKVISFVDLFLFDLKAADRLVHKELTGHENGRILDNLKRLAACGKNELIIRIPYIVGLNDGEMDGLGEILCGLPVSKIEVLPYHRLGAGKYEALGLDTPLALEVPDEELVMAAVERLKGFGLPIV